MADTTKARKPWHRPRNIVFAILLAFVFLLCYAVFWALTAEPAPNVDYGAELERIAATGQAEGPNGWPRLVDALERMESVEASFADADRPEVHSNRIDYDALFYADASPETIAMVRDAVERLREGGAFNRLAEAAECPNVIRPWPGIDEGPLLGALLPDLAQSRQLARARMASMHLALENGDMDEVVAAFEQTMALGRIFSHQPTIIDSLVGQAIAALASRQLRYALLEHELDAPTLRRLLDVARDEAGIGPMDVGLEGERRFMLDMIQRTYTGGGLGGGTFLPAQPDGTDLTMFGDSTLGGMSHKPRIFNLAGLAFAGRKELTDKTNEFYDETIRRSALPRQQRLDDPFDEAAFVQGLNWRFMLLKLMIPALGRAIETRDMTSCNLAGMELMLAIELFHAENGRYPQALVELTPGIVPVLPADPFSPDGFVYRLTGDDEHGRPYLLYSIGADGEDSGGLVSADHPSSALRERDGAGLDYVINAPRPVE